MPPAANLFARTDKYPEWYLQRLLYCWYVLNWSVEEVAEYWVVCESTIWRSIRRFRAGSPTLAASGRTGRSTRKRKLKTNHVSYLLHLLWNRSDLYLDEFAGKLHQKFGFKPSLSTICRAFQQRGVTRKQVGDVLALYTPVGI